MRTGIMAGVLTLLTANVMGAEVTFTLKDYLHHHWREELVTYRVATAKIPRPARLLGADGSSSCGTGAPKKTSMPSPSSCGR